ncbi:MAG TPA: hypothetical protein VIH61_00905 [Waddliaceae bacterium]
MKWIVLFPFLLQGIAILVDEIYFHRKRGLPAWERIGHPLDTLCLLICMSMIIFVPFSLFTLKIYGVLALFSCLMVTKDEFIHKHHCPWAENWLHALLFILHPITLACAALLWPIIQQNQVLPWNYSWLNEPAFYTWFFYLETGLICLFFGYQLIFWNFVWNKNTVIKQ